MIRTNSNKITSDKPLPDGEYVCQLRDVREDETPRGDTVWLICFEVVEGPHAGVTVWKELSFSDIRLVKLQLESVWTDISGEDDLEPGMVLKEKYRATVEVISYEVRRRSRVPFDEKAQVGTEAVDG